MDAKWVEEQNRYNIKSYLEDIHRLAEYITEQRAMGVDFSHKNDSALTIIIQDEIAKNNPYQVDYQELALATWNFLFVEDERRKILDEHYGEGFCLEFDDMTAFNPYAANKYLDQSFELSAGDYIITDPCYIEHKWDYDAIHAGAPRPVNFWEPEFAAAMPSIHMRDTLYGDWGCTVFLVPENTTLEEMTDENRRKSACGQFCADAGQVCIVRLDEVAAYNPQFVSKLEQDISNNPMECHYATVIRNFEGIGSFKVVENTYTYNDETYAYHEVYVIFDGVDTILKSHVHYESRQTLM